MTVSHQITMKINITFIPSHELEFRELPELSKVTNLKRRLVFLTFFVKSAIRSKKLITEFFVCSKFTWFIKKHELTTNATT